MVEEGHCGGGIHGRARPCRARLTRPRRVSHRPADAQRLAPSGRCRARAGAGAVGRVARPVGSPPRRATPMQEEPVAPARRARIGGEYRAARSGGVGPEACRRRQMGSRFPPPYPARYRRHHWPRRIPGPASTSLRAERARASTSPPSARPPCATRSARGRPSRTSARSGGQRRSLSGVRAARVRSAVTDLPGQHRHVWRDVDREDRCRSSNPPCSRCFACHQPMSP
jgi:hypothetical protein